MPVSKLVAKKIGEQDGRTVWEIVEPLIYENGIFKVIVPAGFTCDFCSVPRLPLMWLVVGAIGEEAGTVHDYLYREGAEPKITREEADNIFYHILLEVGISWWKAWGMYKAVRIGAGKNWHARKVNENFLEV